ncbi:LeuA family protein [Halalkalicoccus subterraneus]|uniref:LeuA family protein n=1 Tax=Halalkalicoccus subterraneus TaxID=2675002 RepID=UPI000EFAAB28|nr:citramalate synthase [Halalkalicoccus subterraneus]
MMLNDVTLREGDQMPGREYTTQQKIEAARMLDDLGLPYIQPAFPATGEKDQTVINDLSGTTDAKIIALARSLERDIDVAVDANADIVETFISVSDRHLEHLLDTSREEMLTMLTEAIEYIIDRGVTPHVTLADAFRTDHSNIREVFETIPDVPLVTLADTVGARTPVTVESYLTSLEDDIDLSRLGVHFHDDLGCATANVLAAYQAGVAKADVSIASLGERAGNSALEEVVAACAVDLNDDLDIETTKLAPTCKQVLTTLEETHNDRKAVLGEKTTEHESGIHTAAMLSDPATLEPYDPAIFGGIRKLIFGKPTGKTAIRKLLERADIQPTEDRVSTFGTLLTEQGPLDQNEALALATQTFEDN